MLVPFQSSLSERSETISTDWHSSAQLTERTCDGSKPSDLAVTAEKLSTTHQLVLDSLISSQFLDAVHVEVKNESYWYAMRKRMGAKKHAAMIVKYNETHVRYESYIYKMKIREEDCELVPQKVHVGNSKSKWAAYRACEKACRERDENPARFKRVADTMQPDRILTTHLKVTVVSERFHRVNATDRIGMVYEELLHHMGTNLRPIDWGAVAAPSSGVTQGLGRSAPSRLRLGSIFGENMCSLDLFRVLLPPDSAPFVLLIDARTPSQWRPELYAPLVSERLGTSHMGLRALEVDDASKPARQRDRVKKLTTVVADKRRQSHASQTLPPLPKSPPSSAASPPLSDSLGLDASVSGVRYRKLGGIYGHFFNDLSPEVRDMVMLRYKDNKALIQAEGAVNVHEVAGAKHKARALAIENGTLFQPTFQPHTNMAALRARTHATVHLSEYDRGTGTEAEMMEQVSIGSRRVERVAVRLQRIRRLALCRRAVKAVWWRKYAVLTIQRVMRGIFGRRYAALYRKLKPVAAVRIQVCFRSMRSRVFLRVWRWLTFRLTRVVLPKIKLFIRNCFLSWIAKRNNSATRIQSVVRTYLGRVEFYRRLGQRYFMRDLFPRCAVRMQKVVRGFLGRRRYIAVRRQVLVDRVDYPAALRLQRIYRGRLAKLLLERKKYEFACLVRIQLFVKAAVRRVWDRQLWEAQRIKKAATDIQRVQRGILDREMARMKSHVRWYTTRYLPAIIRVQAECRRYQAVKRFESVRVRAKAAVVLQAAYRKHVTRQAASAIVDQLRTARKYLAVTHIQCMVRRHQAMRRFRRLALEHHGRVVQAAKMIMRAWVNFKAARTYTFLLAEHRHKLQTRKIDKYTGVRRNIQLDIKEIRADIALAEKAVARLKGRVREIDVFLQQAAVRSVNVKKEMSLLTTDDFERGWAEALGQEYEGLNHQMLMAREELRLARATLFRRADEVLHLQLELEEAEVEIDTVELVEVEAAEGMRRSEIAAAEKLATERMAREVRRERSHWRIESSRVRVIQRNRPRYQAIVSTAKSRRDESYATTVSFERHAQQWDREALQTEAALRADARKQDAENKPRTYEKYSAPVQDTYDSVVSGTLSLLRGYTLDERATRLREQQKTTEVKAKKAQRGQFAPLKEEFQKKAAFSYLK